MKCWASALGDCGDVQSGEHYVTKGLFKGKTVIVGGYDWLNGNTKEIGLSSLTANILCNKHNSQLSALDAEAIRAFKILEEINRLENVRRALPRTKIWTVKRHHINWALFERWVAKTLVGLFCVVGKDDHWHLTQTSPKSPPDVIVNAIYGKCNFTAPMGLYLAQAVGDKNTFPDGVSVETFFYPDEGFVGAFFEFKGFRFVSWLTNEQVGQFENPEGVLFGPNAESLIYHPTALRFEIKGSLSQVLKFEWPQQHV